MINRSILGSLTKAALLGAVAVGLASCGGGGGGGGKSSFTPDPIAFFGTVFAADFHAAANSTPSVPQPGNIIPVSLTTYPQPLTF